MADETYEVKVEQGIVVIPEKYRHRIILIIQKPKEEKKDG